MWKRLFGKKKTDRAAIEVAPVADNCALVYVTGKAIPIEECGEPMFEQKTLGDGSVIIPADGKIIAPFDCEVVMSFPTGHAFALRAACGVECMLHLGIDTVHISEPVFRTMVCEGDKISAGTILAYADLEAIKNHNKNIAMLCILTNGDKWRIAGKVTSGEVKAGQSEIMRFERI